MEKKKYSFTEKRYRIFIPVVLILVSLITMLVFEKIIITHNKNTVFLMLDESASDRTKTINTVVVGWYDVLYTLALSIAEQDPAPQTAATLKTANDYSSFSHIAYADTDGYTVDDRGVVFSVADMPFFTDAMSGIASISKTDAFDMTDTPAFVVCVPVKKSGVIIGAVIGTYAADDFEKIMSSRIFNSESYSILCDNDGYILVLTETNRCLEEQSNIFAFLDGKLNSHYSVETILSNFNSSASGCFMYRCDREDKYAVYHPLGINGWYLITIVHESTATTEIKGTQIYEYLAVFIIMLAAVLLFLYHVHYSSKILHQLEEEKDILRKMEERYKITEEFTGSVLFYGDFKSGTIKFGENYEQAYMRKSHIKNITDFNMPNPYIFEEDMPQYLKLGRDIAEGVPSSSAEYRTTCGDKTIRWHRLEYKILFDKNGCPEQIVGKISNIDAQKRQMQKMSIAAETDALTGFFNQDATRRHISLFLKNAGKDAQHGFLLIDIDNFKLVNDRLGHMAGNKTLTVISTEIKTIVRSTDIVGRIGGDEFIIFIKNIPSIAFLAAKASEICGALEYINIKYALGMPISVSIGISVCDHTGSYDILFEEADSALYSAKAQGKNRFVFFKK